jgi:hypothetical protein
MRALYELLSSALSFPKVDILSQESGPQPALAEFRIPRDGN